MITFLATVFILTAILLVLVVLVQRGRGGGLSGAFGAGGGSTSAFGTKTGDVFTMLTVILFVVFMLLAIWLNFKFKDYNEKIQGTLTTAPAAQNLGATPPSDETGTSNATPLAPEPTTIPATGVLPGGVPTSQPK
jgi:preprotein translocase subunit SecG